MQQPVNNRWLSPALQRSATAAPATVRARPATLQQAGDQARAAVSASRYGSVSGDNQWLESSARAEPAYGYGPTATTPRDRQLLMLVAATLLLLGSAAFSYVAWSETVRAPGLPGTVSPQISAAAAGSAGEAPAAGTAALHAADAALESGTASLASQHNRVLALREENDRLRQRLDALQDALAGP